MRVNFMAPGLLALCGSAALLSAQLPGPHGKAKGLVALPGPFAGGTLDAVLLSPGGQPQFELDAVLIATDCQGGPGGPGGPGWPLGQKGTVLGTLEGAGPLGLDVAKVVGTWKAGPEGKGTLELEFVADGPGGPPHAIGGLTGVFGDAQPLPGKLHAGWHLKPQN